MLVDIARRGLSHPHAVAFVKRTVARSDDPDMNMPVWGIALIYVSFCTAVIGITLLSYLLNQVITTLCMVESPVAAITVSPSTHETGDKEEKEELLESGPAITLVNQKPITSSIRGTVKHLVAHAGRCSRFRGLSRKMLYSVCFSFASTFLSAALPKFPGQVVVVAAVSGAAVASVHAAWTHKVVSMPNETKLWQALPGVSEWKMLALPAAISAAMPYLSMYLICGVAMLMGLHKMDKEAVREYDGAQTCSLIVRSIALVFFAVFCTLFLCLPAMVTLIRIEASILPEHQDSIVPFDRTFGGKVVGNMTGGPGKVGFLDAWRSFNWEARRRLIKLFVKNSLIMFGTILFVAHVLLAEIFVVMGPAMGEFMRATQQGMENAS